MSNTKEESVELVKKSGDMEIFKKRSGRFGVKNAKGKWINGDDKVACLKAEGLITVAAAKKVEEPAAEETTEEAAE